MSGIGAGNGEAANQGGLLAGVRGACRVSDKAVAASATLHHEVAIPGVLFGQSHREANAELFAADSFAAIDHAINAAVRGQRDQRQERQDTAAGPWCRPERMRPS